MTRDILERVGRLTSGDKPLSERRKDLTNHLRTAAHCVETSLANWPKEYEIPKDHKLYELIEVINIVCDELEQP